MTTGKGRTRASSELQVKAQVGEDEALGMARLVLRPTVQAVPTLRDYGKGFGDLDLTGLMEALSEQTQATLDGDLQRGEAMLTSQAHTLDAIFNNLARRAALNMGEYMDACETYLKLALRAQSQCRATWEALSAIKNPPTVGYVRQANIAHGPQQVNNAPSPTDEASRARENQNPQSKLLEERDGQRLDSGATGTAGHADQEMATVGEIDPSQDAGR